MKYSRSVYAKAAAVALALAAAGTATVAQARSDVFFSVGANVAPGVAIGVSNAPVYYPPVYVQPQPVYVQPAPVYYGYRPRRSTMRPAPVYYAPAPVYYGPPWPSAPAPQAPRTCDGNRYRYRSPHSITRFSKLSPRAQALGALFLCGRCGGTKKSPQALEPGGNMPVAGRRAGPAHPGGGGDSEESG